MTSPAIQELEIINLIFESEVRPFINFLLLTESDGEVLPDALFSHILKIFSNRGIAVGHNYFYYAAYVMIMPFLMLYKRFDEVIKTSFFFYTKILIKF